jgi:type II secretory pathway component PulF
MGSWSLHLLVLCAAAGIDGFLAIRTTSGKRIVDRIVFGTPLLGSLVLMIEMSRWSRSW